MMPTSPSMRGTFFPQKWSLVYATYRSTLPIQSTASRISSRRLSGSKISAYSPYCSAQYLIASLLQAMKRTFLPCSMASQCFPKSNFLGSGHEWNLCYFSFCIRIDYTCIPIIFLCIPLKALKTHIGIGILQGDHHTDDFAPPLIG